MSDSDLGHDSREYERQFPEAKSQFYSSRNRSDGCYLCAAGICTQRVILFWDGDPLVIHGILEGSQWHS